MKRFIFPTTLFDNENDRNIEIVHVQSRFNICYVLKTIQYKQFLNFPFFTVKHFLSGF